MIRFFRNNPEKLRQFFIEAGPKGGGIGFKQQFAGGGLADMLGEPTYKDGGRIPYDVGGWLKKRFRGYTKEGREEYKKESSRSKKRI